MSASVYKVLHILGLLLVFVSLTGIWGVNRRGAGAVVKRQRVGLSAMHGIGLLVLLISGFGLLAKLGYLSALPTWSIVKLGLWVVLAGSIALAKRKTEWGLALLSLWILAGTLAAYLCVFKPEI